MTQAEWVTCGEPILMLDALGGGSCVVGAPGALYPEGVSGRKLRAFTCLCCREAWPHFRDERSRKAVAAAEDYVDGRVGLPHLESAYRTAERAREEAKGSRQTAAWVAAMAAHPDYSQWIINDLGLIADWAAGRAKRRSGRQQCNWLRDLFGNPFRPVTLPASWVTPAVTDLAQTIYDERAFDRMPELADALEQAGCTNAGILNHCRGPGPHVRGCWVVDLVLAKN